MSESAPAPGEIVGVVPALPWPLSRWDWWTRPVRAERLASLRIALALFLLLDLALTYAPHFHDLFGPDSLGSPELFAWRSESPRLSWSLLRGAGDPLVSFLSLSVALASTAWILSNFIAALVAPVGAVSGLQRPGVSLLVWLLGSSLYVVGVWARESAANEVSALAAFLPIGVAGLAVLFVLLDAACRHRHGCTPDCRVYGRKLLLLLGATVVLAAGGVGIAQTETFDASSWWMRLLAPWQQDRGLLRVALALWIVATVMLLIGFWTPVAAIMTWALSLSFANLNSHIDNAGDTIRGIVLFYLMLCPCGAIWSVDHWLRSRGRPPEVVFVSPWPLRLLFVQMIIIYFCNGVYKLFGNTWWQGDSLYYVLRDLTLTRVSAADLALPMETMRVLTWCVLFWETSFPLLVLWRWTRIPALLFGVGFHLGIFATMELAMFVPYMLCLYVPLLPWERLTGSGRAGRR